MESWRLEALQKINALLAELIATWPEPDPVGTVRPIEFYEIFGGRWDGSYQLVGECNRCKSEVRHIVTADMLEAPDSADVYHRVAHCMCEAYELPRPLIGTLFNRGKPFYPNPKAVSSLGFGTPAPIVRGPDGEPINPSLGLFGPLLNWEDN